MRSALDLQDKIFEEMSMFEQEFEAGRANSTEFDGGSERVGQFGDEEIGDYSHLQTAQVHSDVVFVGFPSSAVEYIERHWLDSLVHESNSEGSYGGKLFDMPGDLSVRHHYHLLQVSFHVADLIRDTMLNMMRGSLTEDRTMEHGFVINAWEIENMLDGLTKEMRSTGPAFELQGNSHQYVASNTIYVLNIDLEESLKQLSSQLGAPAKYSYQNGFTEAQLDRLAKDSKVVQLSKTVLREQSNAHREVITDKDGYSPSLTDKQASEIVQNMMSTWYWPKKDNIDDYGWGYDNHYRRIEQQIHSRQAVKESREWAQGYSDASIHSTLEERALRLLEAPWRGQRGGDYRYSLARAVLRHAAEAAEGGKRYGLRDPSCGASAWISGSDFAWVDQGATAREPHAASLYTSSQRHGGELRDLQPRALRATEWATLGDTRSNLKRDVDAGLSRIGEWMSSHYSSLLSLAKQTRDCPEVVIMDLPRPNELDDRAVEVDRAAGSDADEYGHGWAAEGIDYKGIEQAHASSLAGQACVSILKQAIYLRNCYFHFQRMRRALADAYQNSEVTGLEEDTEALDRHEARIFLGRLKEIHFDSMREVVAAIGADLTSKGKGEGKSSIGVVSEGATVYLGHTLARVLELSEQLTAPPVGVHLDPHSPDLPLPGDATLVSEDGHRLSGAGKRGSKGHSAVEREEELSLHQVGLADYVGSRVGSHAAVGDSSSGSGIDDYSLVTRTLPPLSFPQRIDVAVYVVRLQSTYDPISVDSASTHTSFDYRQLVRSLSDMALPNQELTVSLHNLDVYSQASKGAAFSEAGHEALVLAMRSCQRLESFATVYLDADCVWAHLRTYDSTNAAKSAGTSTGGDQHRRWEDAHQHVPIFVLSVAQEEPLFVNSALDTATAVADGVLAVQNAQAEISTGQVCGDREIRRHGRDPTGAVIQAAGRVIAGISSEHLSKQVAHLHSPDSSLLSLTLDTAASPRTEGQRQDVQCSFGRSVSFHTSADSELGPTAFSSVEVSAAHRARMLRMIGHCHVLLQASVRAALPGTVARRQATIVRTFFVILLGRLLHEVEIVEPSDLSHTASQCNALYFLVENWLHSKQLPDEIYYAIDDSMGGLPLDDREGAGDKWRAQNTAAASDSSGEGFSLFDLLGFWPAVLFVASFASSLFWPKKKKPDRYL